MSKGVIPTLNKLRKFLLLEFGVYPQHSPKRLTSAQFFYQAHAQYPREHIPFIRQRIYQAVRSFSTALEHESLKLRCSNLAMYLGLQAPFFKTMPSHNQSQNSLFGTRSSMLSHTSKTSDPVTEYAQKSPSQPIQQPSPTSETNPSPSISGPPEQQYVAIPLL
jgi:hypothetical protein